LKTCQDFLFYIQPVPGWLSYGTAIASFMSSFPFSGESRTQKRKLSLKSGKFASFAD
jgi:hypothetical protein